MLAIFKVGAKDIFFKSIMIFFLILCFLVPWFPSTDGNDKANKSGKTAISSLYCIKADIFAKQDANYPKLWIIFQMFEWLGRKKRSVIIVSIISGFNRSQFSCQNSEKG